MSRRPPTDFADFVSARSGSLYRTAVLLTHDEQRARELLTSALAGMHTAWGRNRESALETETRRRLVRGYLRQHAGEHRRWADREGLSDVGPTGAPGRSGADGLSDTSRPALGDPLAGLPRRGRAWTVLRSLHAQSVAESAAMLKVSERTGTRLEARSLDALAARSMYELEPVLATVADTFGPPDPRSLILALDTQTPVRRRRRRVGLGVAAVAVLATVAGAASLLTEDSERSEVVRAAEADPQYEGGYGLVDGRPRPYVDGLALEKVEVIDYSLRRKTVSAPDVEEGSPLYAVAFCDLPGNAMDVDAVVDAITVEPHGVDGQVIDGSGDRGADGSAGDRGEPSTVDLSCADRGADTSRAPVISPLPGGVDDFTVAVPAVWSGTGALYLAFYTEVPWSDYPFDAIPANATAPPTPEFTAASESVTVIDATNEPAPEPSLSGLLDGEQASVRSVDVDINTTLELTVRTSEPGQLLVALDGVVLTNDGEELTGLGRSRPGPWSESDPALRQGFWRGYTAAGYHRYLDSGTLSRMGVDITDDTVRVSVIERGFNADGWQVLATADGDGAPPALAPGYADSLPEFAHGLRRVATYQVPTDGEPHPVPLSAEEAEELTWIGACDIETPREVRALTLVTPDRSGLIPCAGYRNEWAAPLMPPASDSPSQAGAGSDTRPTLTAQRTSTATSLTVGAYSAVPYEDFPFDVAGQPSTTPLNLRPVPDEGDLVGYGASDRLSEWTEVDALRESDLDQDGRGQLTVSTDRPNLVTVSTRGRGRFMVRLADGDRPLLDGMFYDPSVLGRVASPLMYREGWWTSWTTESTQWAIPLRRDADGSQLGLDVTVEGYDPGSLDIRVLEGAGVTTER